LKLKTKRKKFINGAFRTVNDETVFKCRKLLKLVQNKHSNHVEPPEIQSAIRSNKFIASTHHK
jgi:hypothetical protein